MYVQVCQKGDNIDSLLFFDRVTTLVVSLNNIVIPFMNSQMVNLHKGVRIFLAQRTEVQWTC